MLGPTAEDLDDKTATGTTAEGIAGLRAQGGRVLPALLDEEVTAVYAGLRAATGQEDYRIAAHPALRYVTVGGIRSTGLSASLAIAEHVLGLLADCGLDPGPERPLAPVRMPNLGEAFPGRTGTPDSSRGSPGSGRWSATASGSPGARSGPRSPPRSPGRPRRAAAQDPGPGRPLPGHLLRRGGAGAVRGVTPPGGEGRRDGR